MHPCRFPFFAADVLASNAMILQALLAGGWNNAEEKEEEEEAGFKSEELSDEDPPVEPV